MLSFAKRKLFFVPSLNKKPVNRGSCAKRDTTRRNLKSARNASWELLEVAGDVISGWNMRIFGQIWTLLIQVDFDKIKIILLSSWMRPTTCFTWIPWRNLFGAKMMILPRSRKSWQTLNTTNALTNNTIKWAAEENWFHWRKCQKLNISHGQRTTA